jgi:uncharacterized membrane protein YgaE (UPF0421/DUF939 family)
MTLLFNAVFFSTIVNQRSIPYLFVFLLLELFVIGMFISICISLFIFPLFATFDIENRFNYCLFNLQRMYQFVIQAFLSENEMNSKVSLSRASIIENETRLLEAKSEPSRLLKKVFYSKRREIIDLNIQGLSFSLNSKLISFVYLFRTNEFIKFINV